VKFECSEEVKKRRKGRKKRRERFWRSGKIMEAMLEGLGVNVSLELNVLLFIKSLGTNTVVPRLYI